ncbi:MAG: hypothetical protein ABMB14_10710 [Myxococcota bacterium]
MPNGEPPQASGVQFGEEGLRLCGEASVEPWDADDIPDLVTEAPAVLRDQAVGAWLGDAAIMGGGQAALAVELALADGPVELVRMTPADRDGCEGEVRIPITVAVDGGSAVAATLAGTLAISATYWYFDTFVDGAEVAGTLLPSNGVPLAAAELEFGGLTRVMDALGPMETSIHFKFYEPDPGVEVDPNAYETWAQVVLTR